MRAPIFKGICTALVTPFNDDNSIDYVSLKKMIEFQVSGGVSALLFLGTTGEASTITLQEKKAITEFAVKEVDKRLPIIIGIGGNNPANIIEFGTWLRDLPIDGVLLSSPYYNKTSENGLVQFFHSIASAISLPIIVYNVPSRTGQNISPETFAKICKNEYIRGIKEASGNITQIAETMRLCPNVAMYSGDDALSLPVYALGGLGTISVASNARPKETQEVFDLAQQKSFENAQKLFFEQLPFYKSLFVEVNPIPVKYVLSKMGLIKNNLRPPLLPLS